MAGRAGSSLSYDCWYFRVCIVSRRPTERLASNRDRPRECYGGRSHQSPNFSRLLGASRKASYSRCQVRRSRSRNGDPESIDPRCHQGADRQNTGTSRYTRH
nr:putative integron gene cassette protein [uncultured bacterium]CAP48638.1 putative integron gene cassette protein [uncultured bacterium]CAP48645.1 putative integron gene cassette protein [uncultured bacterium]